MRNQLSKLSGKRISFIAQFIRYGQLKKGYYDPYSKTLLLKRLSTSKDNMIVADHLWVNADKNPILWKTDLKEGCFIRFLGKVVPYQKGYKGRRIDLIFEKPIENDYELSNISNIEIIDEKILC